ncbi:DUF1533 domain-containing protein [Anaerobutyricum hallii]|nr:DUF1533 domain-containing protein [Anaerobutyricum hallii]
MRKISSVIMACAMCLSMAVVGTVAPQVAVQAEETAAVELKEAPTETPTLDKDFGYEWYLIQYPEYTANSENTKSWMEKITSIKVNDAEPYTKVDNKFLMKEDTFRAYVNMVNITIGNKEFTKDTNKVVISAEGYKDLVLEVGKDYKKLPSTQNTQAEQLLVRRKQSAISVEKNTESAHLITMEMNMSLTELITGRNVRMKVVMLRLKKKHIKVAKLQQQREQSVKCVEQNMELQSQQTKQQKVKKMIQNQQKSQIRKL